MTRKLLQWFGIVALVAGVAACSKTFIPNTDVEDTGENRRSSSSARSTGTRSRTRTSPQLLKLMSPGYFEDGGNTKTEDDADFDKIREFLTGDFLKTTGVRYEIRYRRITFTETNHIYIDYTYAAAWKIPGAKNDEWHHAVADNRLDLVRDGRDVQDRRRDVIRTG